MQGTLVFLVWMAATGLIYLSLLGIIALLVSRWWSGSSVWRIWRSIGLGVAFAAVGVPLLEGLLLHGIVPMRTGWWPHLPVLLVVCLAGGIQGYLGSRRQASRGHPRTTDLTTGISAALAAAVFLMLTLPFVDLLSACFGGARFFGPASC